ncbi:Protein of unknown function [Desulfatibacillum alkenivorans DSM 16219]|uniref:DUF3592 domain-containing protein n=1 Tax=Desulfatibacillum alkenivorans DSM 16219 TaxID=1121393 RepID=A0A1M6XUY4_9BACT|nr:DUF3592 domain-containing protein [Desulfatibacillum alkenivorans]SHL09797.1 Protein of unknown function [Desulfatibacillum alkenivorans DSM 16219]
MAPEEKKQTRLTPLFAVVAVVFGLALAGTVHQIIQQSAMSRQWQPVQGVVVKVSQDGWWNDQEKRRYYLEYAYTVQGMPYTGYRYHLREKSLKTYGGIQYRYKQGDPITVYYDPEDPGRAVLSREFLRDWFAGVAVLVGLLVFAVAVMLKESNDSRTADSVGATYDGASPLPNAPGVEDSGAVLKLNTGMSLMWKAGVPFFGGCFIGITPLLLLTDNVNPGWGLQQYGAICCAIWIGAALLALLISLGVSYTLYVDAHKKEIREESRVGFSKGEKTMAFSEILEIRLYRELWRKENPLKNWIMFIQSQSGRSLNISRGYRDYQTPHADYLGAIKARIEYMIAK